jgi:tetratricopeptide (TPR) repeat protein
MSLINNMLKDLESRQLREAYDQDKLMGGVKVRGAQQKKLRWMLPVLIFLFVLVLVITAVLYFLYQPVKMPEIAKAAPEPVIQEPIVETVRGNEVAAISNRTSEKGEQLIVTLQGRAGGVTLRQSGSDTSLTLKQVTVPENYSLSATVLAAFPGIAIEAKDKDVRILLPLARGESVKLVDGGSKDNQQLILTRTYQKPVRTVTPKKKPQPQATQVPAVAPVSKPEQKVTEDAGSEESLPVIKQRSPKSVAERAEQSYKQAYAALQEGQLGPAEDLLRQSIGLNPSPEAYLALAGILIKQGNTTDAKQLLRLGLQQLPGNADMAYLYARLLVDSGQAEQAHKVLANALAQGRNDGEYLALLAAVSRQLGHNEMAAQAYVEALNLNPKQAVWWMGLGLALDDNKQTSQAIEAYYKALGIGLGDSLDSYVMQRVQELEGEQ